MKKIILKLILTVLIILIAICLMNMICLRFKYLPIVNEFSSLIGFMFFTVLGSYVSYKL